MTYRQGDVVVATDPFGYAPTRPYLVISNDARPFQGEDYLVAGITATERSAAISLAGEFDDGRLNRRSYVSPWVVLTIRNEHVEKRVAVVTSTVVSETAAAIADYVGAA